MFFILSEKLGSLDTLKLLNEKTGEYVTIIPGLGATLNELVLKKNNELHSLIDGSPTYEDLLTEGKLKFKGPKLFPFPNRIRDGRYSFEDKEFRLRKNLISEKHAIHGLHLESKFEARQELKESDKASIRLEIIAGAEEKEGFPFSHQIIIDYILSSQDGLICTTTVVNRSSGNMPMGDGWHPYFKLDARINSLLLKLPPCSKLEADQTMIPTGNFFKEERFKEFQQIGTAKFDDCFRIDSDDPISEIHLKSEEKNVKLIIWQQSEKNRYNFFQIYTPPHRQSIAIEPMSCAPDAFNNKIGLIILKPGEEISFSYGIKLA
ncbi:MAG: aldose 1-epimerase [Cytophagaceae bacterium]